MEETLLKNMQLQVRTWLKKRADFMGTLMRNETLYNYYF